MSRARVKAARLKTGLQPSDRAELHVYLPRDLYLQVFDMAKASERSITGQARFIITEYLQGKTKS